MPQVLAFVAPAVFGAAGSLALVGAAGGLTLAGSIVSIGGGLLLRSALTPRQRPVTPENIQLPREAAVGPRVRHCGRVKVAGEVVFRRAKSGFLDRIVVFGHGRIDGIEAFEIDRHVVTRDGGNYVQQGQWQFSGAPRLRIVTREGTVPSTYYSALETRWPVYTAAHRLDGLWTAWIEAEQVSASDFARVYPNGPPTLVMTARTARVFDPRVPTTAFSENAALIIADLIEGADGFNMPNEVDDTVLAASADAADDGIQLAAGGTEARWRLAGSWALSEPPGEVLGRMLDACAGDVRALPSGLIGIYTGKWAEPTVTIAASEVIELQSWSGGPDRLSRYTELPFVYVDRALGYQPTTGQTWVDATRETANGEVAVGPQADFTFAPSHGQARRAAKYRIEADNPAHEIILLCKPSALRAIFERWIDVDMAELPVVHWRLRKWSLNPLTGEVLLDLASFNDAALATWDEDTEEGAAVALPAEPTTDGIPTPSIISVVGSGVQVTQVDFAAGIAGSWTAPASPGLEAEVEFSVANANAWRAAPVAAGATAVAISPLTDGGAYDVRVRFRASDGTPGDWATVEDVIARAVSTAPDALAAMSATVADGLDVLIAFTAPEDDAFAWADIFRADYAAGTDPGTAVFGDAVLVKAGLYALPGGSRTWTDVDPGEGLHVYWGVSRNASNIGTTPGVSAHATIAFALASVTAAAEPGRVRFTATAPASAAFDGVRIYRAATGGGFGAAVEVGETLGLTPGAGLDVVAGDATAANLFVNPGFGADTDWTKGTGWSIAGGAAVKAAGTAASIWQAPTLAAGAAVRFAWTVLAYVAGSVRPTITGTTTAAGTFVSADGRFTQTVTAPAAPDLSRFTTTATGDLSIDDVVAFVETVDCLAQGAADFWVVPVNGAGAEGPPSGPFNRVIP